MADFALWYVSLSLLSVPNFLYTDIVLVVRGHTLPNGPSNSYRKRDETSPWRDEGA